MIHYRGQSAHDCGNYLLLEALLTLTKIHYYLASVLVFFDRNTKGLRRAANDYT